MAVEVFYVLFDNLRKMMHIIKHVNRNYIIYMVI